MVSRSQIVACVLYAHYSLQVRCFSLAANKNGFQKSPTADASQNSKEAKHPFPKTFSFSVPLKNARPKPESPGDTFIELWNDPRPVSSLFNGDRSTVGERITDFGDVQEIPYCIISDEFQIGDTDSFQILLYPRGRFVSSATSPTNGGPASAYMRYLPKKYGDEIDIAWNMQLCVERQIVNITAERRIEVLPVSTSGGLPKSNTTWSAGMTFCAEMEAVESVGRATDWGSSIWSAKDVCQGLDGIVARGEVTVYAKRSDESSFAVTWPPFSKGALAAVLRSTVQSDDDKEYRVGEVIVARRILGYDSVIQRLQEQYVYPGIDYRIMTMSDGNGNPIFSTESLSSMEAKQQARLALRPCGWKLQQQLWKNQKGMKTDWPVEVTVEELATVTSSRFNPASAFPRLISAFQRDWKAYALALAIAITPIPAALFLRTFVSFYAIPSASMEPTLLKGDVLLVEKFPKAYERTNRGDVILFRPPPALKDIVLQSGSQLSSTSLFVKRIVGMPGDRNVRLLPDGSNDVVINGEPAVGPDRSLCQDEPLGLINRLLDKSGARGKDVTELGKDNVYVLGDCKAVSVDSRVFGVLPKQNIIGKPVARIWPLDRIQLSNKF